MSKVLVLAVTLLTGAVPASGQSVLDRSPDLSGGWVGDPGHLYFNFMHRFDVGPEPARNVTNTPTFTVGVPVTNTTLVGFSYATNSTVARGRPNEWEFLARWAPLTGHDLWDASLHGGYNLGAGSLDGELTAGADFGTVRAFGVGRAFSGWRDTDSVRFAVGGGAVIRLHENAAVVGDVVTPVDPASDEDPAWSAGLHLRIPYTPHTLSLHASNAATTTLQGSTVGSGALRYGFEFTIPVTFRRYFRGSGSSADAMTEGMDDAMAPMDAASGDTVEIRMESLAYERDLVVIRPGATVVWINDDPVAHTATADDGSWDSDLIEPGARWARTFHEVGEHAYHCTPHPFMKAVVAVEEEGGME